MVTGGGPTVSSLRALGRPGWAPWAIYAVVPGAAGSANLIAVTVAAGHLVIVLGDFCQRTVRVGGEDDGGRALPGGRLDPQGSPLLLVRRFLVAAVAGLVLVSPLVIAGHTQQGWQIGQQVSPHVAQAVGISGGLWQGRVAPIPAPAPGSPPFVPAPGAGA